jgi:hypothetical protein
MTAAGFEGTDALMELNTAAIQIKPRSGSMIRTGLFSSRLSLLLLVCLALALRSLAWNASLVSYDPDEAVYFVMAQQWLAGHLPYVAVWDQHPVGLPAILAAGGWLVGDVLRAGRMGASIAVGVTAWLILRFVATAAGSMAPAAIGAVLYVICMNRLEALPTQTEVFNNLLVSAAAWLLFSAARRPWPRDMPAVAGASLLLGTALQVKYVVFPECVLLCCGYLAYLRADRLDLRAGLLRAGLMIGGGLAPTALVCAIYWWAGDWSLFWQANVTANLAYASDLPAFDKALTLIWDGLRSSGILVPVTAAVLWESFSKPGTRHARLRVWLGLWVLANLLNICLPMKFYHHYFLALLPPMCIAGGLTLAWVIQRLPEPRRPKPWRPRLQGLAVTALAAAMLAIPTRAALLHAAILHDNNAVDAPRLIAADIARLGPGDLYVYNDSPILYYLTARLPPTRYVLPLELQNFASSSGAHGPAEVAAAIARRPRYVVTSDPPRFAFAPKIDALVNALLAIYDVAASYPNPVAGNRLRLHVAKAAGAK